MRDNPMLKIVTGTLLILSSVCLFFYGKPALLSEKRMVERYKWVRELKDGSFRVGDQISIEGRVSDRNPVLVHNFVAARKEKRDKQGGSNGEWILVHKYIQPLIIEVQGGQIHLLADDICVMGDHLLIIETDEKTEQGEPVRYVGVKPKAPVFLLGIIKSADIVTMQKKISFVGTRDQYLDRIDQGTFTINAIILLLLTAGIALVGWGLYKK